MSDTPLSQVDLNLLVILEDLLRTSSVTETARRLGRTQSAVSHALRRLRDVFADPLFVRMGAVLKPTARARELEEPLRELVHGAERILSMRGTFEPARLRRRFTVAASDFAELVVLPRLLPILTREAPGVELNVVFVGGQVDQRVQNGEVDLAWGAGFQPLSGLLGQKLFEERNVCVVRQGHPRVRTRLTMEDFVREAHAVIAPRGPSSHFVDEALARLGRERRVLLRVPHFVTAPLVVASTDLLLVMPSRVAEALVPLAPLAVFEPPLELPTFFFSQVYAEANRTDAAHAWLRARVAEVCARPAPPPPPPSRRSQGAKRARRMPES